MYATVFCLLLSAPTSIQDDPTPPGMVFVSGGPTAVGIDLDSASALVRGDRARVPSAGPRVDVPDFYLGVTEVTNEQYLAFVDATGARPPESWGMPSIDAASRAWAAEQNLAARHALAEGREHERAKFDQGDWWRRNWRDCEWSVPVGAESQPVTYVDYRDAEDYATWAGVRLMNELEYQRAGRGDTDDLYPWGDDWDPAACANQELGLHEPRRVGSSTPHAPGVYDLAGNVWEWTSSPFVPYGHWNARGMDSVIRWDANQRVVVGGSYQLGSAAARLTTRRGTERTQSAEALGFRVAASPTPALDIAAALVRRELHAARRPTGTAGATGVEYDTDRCVGLDRWKSSEGTAATPGATSRVPLASYAIITAYDYVVFIPVRSVEATSIRQLDRASHEPTGPIHVGMLSSSRDILAPALPAGTYRLAYRGPGPLRDHEVLAGAEAARAAEPLDRPTTTYPAGFAPLEANLVAYDTELQIAAVFALDRITQTRPSPPTVVVRETTPVPAPDPAEPAGAGVPGPLGGSITEVAFRAATRAKSGSRGFELAWVLRFPAGQLGPEWRR